MFQKPYGGVYLDHYKSHNSLVSYTVLLCNEHHGDSICINSILKLAFHTLEQITICITWREHKKALSKVPLWLSFIHHFCVFKMWPLPFKTKHYCTCAKCQTQVSSRGYIFPYFSAALSAGKLVGAEKVEQNWTLSSLSILWQWKTTENDLYWTNQGWTGLKHRAGQDASLSWRQ